MKYTMTFYDSLSEITIEDINATNLKLGFSIPSQYSDFLLEHNGGQPEFNLFKGYDENGNINNQILINVFFGIAKDYKLNIYNEYLSYSDILKNIFLPIGADGAGNVLCIGLKDGLLNKVYRLYTDVPENNKNIGTSGFNNIDYICEDFNTLFKGLVSEEEFEF